MLDFALLYVWNVCFNLTVVVCLCYLGFVGLLCLRLVHTAGELFFLRVCFGRGHVSCFFGVRFDLCEGGWFRF